MVVGRSYGFGKGKGLLRIIAAGILVIARNTAFNLRPSDIVPIGVFEVQGNLFWFVRGSEYQGVSSLEMRIPLFSLPFCWLCQSVFHWVIRQSFEFGCLC